MKAIFYSAFREFSPQRALRQRQRAHSTIPLLYYMYMANASRAPCIALAPQSLRRRAAQSLWKACWQAGRATGVPMLVPTSDPPLLIRLCD